MSDIITCEDYINLLNPLLEESHKVWAVGTRRWEIACGLIARAFRAGKRSGIKSGETEALDEVYKWLVEELAFPFDMSTREKPPWLDVGKLARFWNEHDNWGITQEDAEAMVWYETGWDHEYLG